MLNRRQGATDPLAFRQSRSGEARQAGSADDPEMQDDEAFDDDDSVQGTTSIRRVCWAGSGRRPDGVSPYVERRDAV